MFHSDCCRAVPASSRLREVKNLEDVVKDMCEKTDSEILHNLEAPRFSLVYRQLLSVADRIRTLMEVNNEQ